MALSKQSWLFNESQFHKVVVKHKKVIVYTFDFWDTEDPEIYAAKPIYEWQQTEQGKFVMENSLVHPSYHISLFYGQMQYQCKIVAYFDEKTATFYKLKYL
jgi:hypothetical protein